MHASNDPRRSFLFASLCYSYMITDCAKKMNCIVDRSYPKAQSWEHLCNSANYIKLPSGSIFGSIFILGSEFAMLISQPIVKKMTSLLWIPWSFTDLLWIGLKWHKGNFRCSHMIWIYWTIWFLIYMLQYRRLLNFHTVCRLRPSCHLWRIHLRFIHSDALWQAWEHWLTESL